MNSFRLAAAATLVVALSTVGFAQTDQGKVTGTVRDTSGAFVAGASVTVKNERTGEQRTAGDHLTAACSSIGGLKPSIYTIHVAKSGFAPIEYTAMPLAVGQDLPSISSSSRPASRKQVTVVAATRQRRHELGAHRRQRQRARGAEPAGERPPDVAAPAAGAGLAERRHRHVAGHPVQRPRRRAERHPLRRRRRARRSSTPRPGSLNGEIATPFKLQASLENVQEFRVESSATPPSTARAPAVRSASITKSGSNSFHGSAFEYRETTGSTRRTISIDRARAWPKTPLHHQSVRRIHRRADREGQGFFFGSFEGYRLDAGFNFVEGVPSAAAWSRAVPADRRASARVHRAGRGDSAWRVDERRLRHRAAPGTRRRSEKTPSAAASTSG